MPNFRKYSKSDIMVFTYGLKIVLFVAYDDSVYQFLPASKIGVTYPQTPNKSMPFHIPLQLVVLNVLTNIYTRKVKVLLKIFVCKFTILSLYFHLAFHLAKVVYNCEWYSYTLFTSAFKIIYRNTVVSIHNVRNKLSIQCM